VITRLLGFGLSILGTFAIGYSQGVKSVIGPTTIPHLINDETTYVPGLAPQIIAAIQTYIQQNVSPNLNTYLVVGIVVAIGGVALVAIGDRKPKSPHEQGASKTTAAP